MDSSAQNHSSKKSLLYRYIPPVFITIVLFLGGSVLVGWLLKIPTFTRILPALPAMNPLTAISFVLLSCSFLAYWAKKKTSLLMYISVGLAILVMIVMSAHFFQLTVMGDSIIDILIFRNRLLDPTQPPARTALSTALSFLLLAGSIVTLPFAERFRSTFSNQLLAIVTFQISFIALIFYITKQVAFFEIPFFFGMALHTAISFLLLSIGLLFLIKNRFKTRIILTDIKSIIGLLIAFLVVWFSYITPELTKLSNTFSYKADIFSTDNFYDIEKNQFTGQVISDTNFSYEVVRKTGSTLEIKNTFDVKKPNGEPIFSVERLYGIDQFTGQHVAGYGDQDRSGYLFGPENADKENFTYWHINYNEPAEMSFVAEEDLFGLTTYKYESNYTADQTEELTNLPEVGETKGITLDIYLQLWIDPQTGRMIKYQDDTTAYYYDLESGEQLYPWNKFSNSFTIPAVENQVILAREQRQTTLFVVYIIPLLISLVTSFFVVAYFIDEVSSANSLDFLPLAILVIGSIVSVLIWYLARENTTDTAKAKFDSEIQTITSAITKKMDSYDLALQSTRGLLEASEDVSRDEWKAYVDSLNLPLNFSGVQGVGYSIVLQPDEVTEHIADVRAEGYSNYTVNPIEPERDVYTAIVYLEPFDFRNQRAFGYDMFSQETRRAAMTRARDTGETAISGKVILLQETDEDVQPGFLMYIPYYGKDTTLTNSSEREESIVGYVYSPFRARDLMKSVFLNTQYKIHLEILDGNDPDASFEENGLYGASLDGDESVDITTYTPRFTSTKEIDVYGRPWTLRFYTQPDYSINPLQETSANILLIGGLIFTGLATYAVNLLIYSRSRAVSLANQITKDLQQKTALLDESNKVLSEEIEERKKTEEILKKRTDEIERVNKLMIGRELKMVELKKKLENS